MITEVDAIPADIDAYSFPGYNLVYPSASVSGKVRVAMLVSSNIKHDHLSHVESPEVPVVACRLPSLGLLILGVYRQFSHAGEAGLALEKQQMDVYFSIIRNAAREFRLDSLTVLGDVNLDMGRVEDTSYSRRPLLEQWLGIMRSEGLHWQQTDRTYLSYYKHNNVQKSSTLDHVYVSEGVDVRGVQVLSLAATDHFPVEVELHLRQDPASVKRQRLPRIQIRHLDDDALRALAAEFTACGTSSWPHPPEDRSATDILADIYSVITPALDKYAPRRTIKVRKNTPPLLLSAATRSVMRQRDEARRTGSASYKSLRNRAVSLIKADRMQTARNRLNAAGHSLAAGWSLVSDVMKPRLPQPLLHGTKSDKESAEVLNKFYVDKIENLRAKLPNAVKKCGQVSATIADSTFELHSVGIQAVHKAINRLSSSRAKGCDELPSAFWKRCRNQLALPICHLVNRSFAMKEVPATLKRAQITPVLKKGKDPEDPASWRPVALLPTLAKIMEYIVQDQLATHLEDLLPPQQHGFRQMRSTATSLVSCMYRWARKLEERKHVGIIGWDFTAAFDTVDVDTVVTHLKLLGVGESSLEWFRSYMTGGRQQVIWNMCYSSWMPVVYGVRQGSVLGPLLFIVCCCSLPAALESDNRKDNCISSKDTESTDSNMYADDSSADVAADSLEGVISGLRNAHSTMQREAAALGLSLNEAKTQWLVAPKGARLSAMDMPSSTSGHFELLGFVFDAKLSPLPYATRLLTMMQRTLGVVRRTAALLPPDLHKRLAGSLTLGRLSTYVHLTWHVRLNSSSPTTTSAASLQVVINDIARAVGRTRRADRIPVAQLLDQAGLQSLNQLVAKGAALLVWSAAQPQHPLHELFLSLQMDSRTRSGVANMLAAPSPMVTKVAIPVANMRAIWNAWSDLRDARTKREAKRVIKRNIRDVPI